MPVSLPLFPLRTVLFPGGVLRLRIFERRYLDMVRECGHRGSGFGVCLILDGAETGAAAQPAAIGTRARIIDFYTGADGLLGITVEGETRFHVDRARVRDNGLIVADLCGFAPDRSCEVPAEHGLLVRLLEHLLARDGALPDDARLLDDAAWVGWRLGERLPLSPCDRQLLLQTDEPEQRLDRLIEWLPRLTGAA